MKLLAVISCLFLLAACDMITPPWKRAHLKEIAAQEITCEAGKDCDDKWARALKWVKRKSKFGIVTQNSHLIQTGKSLNLSSDVAFTIIKVWIGPGHYRIDYTAYCDDDIGCTPPLLELKANFVQFVTGATNSTIF